MLRGALLGFGFIAESGHVPDYQKRALRGEARIVAVADVSEARRQVAKRLFPQASVHADYREVLALHGAELDFVDICVPPYAHAEIGRAALARGLHVLCEKPLAATPDEARSMIEQALASRRVLFPCHNYRYAPVIAEVRSLLAADVIGQPRLITLQTFRTKHARGVDGWRPDWRREKRYAGGGIAMDHGSHTFYLAFEWMRSYPTSVSAKLGNLSSYDTEDNFSCVLTFPTGIATAHLTWTAGVRKVMYTLHGDRGAIAVDDDAVVVHHQGPTDGGQAPLVDAKRAASHWMDASHKEWFGGLFDDFQRAIREGDYIGPTVIDALQCIETIHAGYHSGRQRSTEMIVPSTASPA